MNKTEKIITFGQKLMLNTEKLVSVCDNVPLSGTPNTCEALLNTMEHAVNEYSNALVALIVTASSVDELKEKSLPLALNLIDNFDNSVVSGIMKDMKDNNISIHAVTSYMNPWLDAFNKLSVLFPGANNELQNKISNIAQKLNELVTK